jgi:hypothetical protein
MRRRALLAASESKGEGSLFPMYIQLIEVGYDDYMHEPSPASIALADFFVANAQFDGAMGWNLDLGEDQLLYIDGVQVTNLSVTGTSNSFFDNDQFYWYPSKNYGGMMAEARSLILSGNDKGTIRVWDDD